MASTIAQGRYTASTDQPFVVFLIGMRVNRPLALRKWLPVATAMGPMIKHLMQHPEAGLLHAETFFTWPRVLMVQYWRSFEDLERFARDENAPHLQPWRDFYKRSGKAGDAVGIYHETYRIEPGNYEAIYANMPVFGLAAATQHITVAEARASARARLQSTGAQ
jgi:hypothetical protein